VWVENGKTITKMFDSADAANLYVSRTEVGQAEGTWITKDRLDVTLGDMWGVWIAAKTGRAASTVAGYRAAWRHIEPTWQYAPCWKITRAAFSTWIPTVTRLDGTGAALSGASLRKVGIVFHALLDQAVELGVITKNPMRSSDIPRQGKSDRRYLTVAEIDRLNASRRIDGILVQLPLPAHLAKSAAEIKTFVSIKTFITLHFRFGWT